MSKQDSNQVPTLQLATKFIQAATANYPIKEQIIAGNPIAQVNYQVNLTLATGIWNQLKTKTDFDPNIKTQADGQSLALWSLELLSNDLTIDIHEFGKQYGINPTTNALSFNYLDVNGRSTCFWSAVYKNPVMVKYCLQNGTNVNITDTQGLYLPKVILNKMAFMNDSDVTDSYPIWKILFKHVEIPNQNQNNIQSSEYNIPMPKLRLLVGELNNNQPTIVSYGEQALPNDCLTSLFLPSKGMLPYYFACHKQLGPVANNIVKTPNLNIDVDHVDSKGWGHIHWLINLPEATEIQLSSKLEQLKLLVQKGCNVNLRDIQGKTPLHWTNFLSKATIEGLIKAGADVNIQDQNGFTAITSACFEATQNREKSAQPQNAGVKQQLEALNLKASCNAGYILKSAVANGCKINLDVVNFGTGYTSPLGHWLLEAHCNKAENNDVLTTLAGLGYDFSKVDSAGKTMSGWAHDYGWDTTVEVLGQCASISATALQGDLDNLYI